MNLSEESDDSSRAPGLAGLASTVILLVTYVAVAVAIVAYAGLGDVESFDDDAGVLGSVAESVFDGFLGSDALGSVLASLVVVAVIISGISSAQTTILPGSRTSLSMAAAGALPKPWAKIHPRFLTPAFGTIVIGVLATLWYVPGKLISENFLFDSLSALSLMIAFYYGLTGIACVIYWRHELFRSAKNFIFIGVAPLIGAGLLGYLLYESVGDLSEPRGVVLGHRGTRPRRPARDRDRLHGARPDPDDRLALPRRRARARVLRSASRSRRYRTRSQSAREPSRRSASPRTRRTPASAARKDGG